MTADLSRNCGQDLFTITVEKLFGCADRIRFISLRPPRIVQVRKVSALVYEVLWETRESKPVHLAPIPVRVTPPVYLGWDVWHERIYCIATRVLVTDDAWAHAWCDCYMDPTQ